MRFTISTRKFFLGVSSAALIGATATPALADDHGKKMTTAELNKMSAMQTTSAATSENSILQPWTGPYDGVPPWDEVKVSDFPAAFQATMDKIQADVNAIRDNPAPATFENFTVPMELVGNEANNLFSIWGVYSSNLSNDEVREIQGEWLPKVSAFFDQLTLDPKLLAKTKAVYDNRKSAGLDAMQTRLVERNYEQLVRDGALLGDADKQQLIAYNTELSKAFNDFSNKVLADEETFIFLTDEADLAGLPDSFVASLAEAAEEQGKTGCALKNTRSVMQPLMSIAATMAIRTTPTRPSPKS